MTSINNLRLPSPVVIRTHTQQTNMVNSKSMGEAEEPVNILEYIIQVDLRGTIFANGNHSLFGESMVEITVGTGAKMKRFLVQ